MSEKKVKCPWCEKVDTPVQINKVQSGNVVERRCGSCGKVLASYTVGEGDFLPKIRVFKNS